MSKELERATKGVLASKSTSGATGKVMVAGGSAAIALSVVAALIPFVGVLGLGIIMLVIGVFMWE